MDAGCGGLGWVIIFHRMHFATKHELHSTTLKYRETSKTISALKKPDHDGVDEITSSRLISPRHPSLHSASKPGGAFEGKSSLA